MRGRPKLPDSRDNQYRVRLNDMENEMLEYASGKAGKAKSEIFRLALLDYYNKVRLKELSLEEEDEADPWGLDGISLQRVVDCPHCGARNRIDVEEESTITSSERQMGAETLYEFDFLEYCSACGKGFRVSGYISEYPSGAFNYEEINVEADEEDEEE